MKELRGNLWELARGSILCITTNGFVKSNGECVMGRGIAQAAAKKFPELPKTLGTLLKTKGNNVHILGLYGEYILVSFPVKPEYEIFNHTSQVVRHMQQQFSLGTTIPGWACAARLPLIEQSVEQIQKLNIPTTTNVYIPRPGCGAGELTWEQVKPMMEVLPNNFFVCTF